VDDEIEVSTEVEAPVEDSETPAEEATETPRETPAESTPAPEPPLVRKIKVNGEVREVPIEDLERHYTLAEGAQSKFEQAAQMLREARARDEALKKNPVKALLDAGLTRDQIYALSEKTVLEQMEEERLTPEQRRIRELEADLARRDEEKNRQAAEAEEQVLATQQQAYAKDLGEKLTESFTKLSLPTDDLMLVAGVSRFLQHAIQAGEDVSPADAVAFVRHETIGRTQSLLGKLSGEQLIEWLGKANVEKLRKADINQLTSTTKEPSATPKASVPAKDRTRREVSSADDFFDSL